MELSSAALDNFSLPNLLRNAIECLERRELLSHIHGLDPANFAFVRRKASVDTRKLKSVEAELRSVAEELSGEGLITPLHGEKLRQARRNLKQVILGASSVCRQSNLCKGVMPLRCQSMEY